MMLLHLSGSAMLIVLIAYLVVDTFYGDYRLKGLIGRLLLLTLATVALIRTWIGYN